ncbi:MAG: BREX-1 system phosphatase PglZ type A, partial [Bacteroidota bacterium]
RKVFVIISDAFRYEAARELADELNGRYRIQADISSQLGVLPSYTTLGMASLLPHASLAYKLKGAMLVDERPVSDLEQRNKLLLKMGGLACKSDMLMGMKKDEGRALTNGKRVVYIYHDTIDAIGDKAATEDKTFMAVRKAIDELAALVNYIINNLNGNHILVTADHGFLFTESSPGEIDKSKLADKPSGTVVAKKRYLIGLELPDNDMVWHGQISRTAGIEGDMEFWVPKGINRFHFTSGSRFIHGGAMPQEIVVPVITVKQVKEKEAMSRTKPKQTRVQVLGMNHRITTARYRFELIQTDPVGERIKPVTLKAAVYDGDEPVTDIVAVTFDSDSGNMDERRRSVTLTLREGEYDKKRRYRLSLRDAETGIEQQHVDVIIDRAFTDDF